VSTPAGDVEVGILKLRQGSFFPELLEPRRRIDKALWAVTMRAYITGTSTRTVDDLVKALGCDSGVSKSTVLRICKITTMSPSMSARAASRWTRG
jgi:transposase-like protein